MTVALTDLTGRTCLTPNDVTAVADLAIVASRPRLDPDARVARLLLGIADLLGAEGAALYDSDALALPSSQQGRWSSRDSRQLSAGAGGCHADGVLVEWIDDSGGCSRMSVVGRDGRTHYVYSRLQNAGRRHVTVGLKRQHASFTPADACLLRAFLDSAAGRLLLTADRRAGRVDRRQSSRMRQVLSGLKGGGSEKEIAADLRISPHTVHVYVKQIYRHYHVHSRAELLRLWVCG